MDTPNISTHDPAIKAAAAAWHQLVDAARACAVAAALADATRLDVTADYAEARDELAAAAHGGVLHEVYEASVRFQAAVRIPPDAVDQVVAAGGVSAASEVNLIVAVVMLRGSLIMLKEAQVRLVADSPG